MKKLSFKEKNNNFLEFVVVEQNNKQALLLYYELLMNCYNKKLNNYFLIKNDNISLKNIQYDVEKLNLKNNIKFRKNIISLLKNSILRVNLKIDKDLNDILNVCFIAFNLYNNLNQFETIDLINSLFVEQIDNKKFLLKFNSLFFNNDLKMIKYINSLKINQFD